MTVTELGTSHYFATVGNAKAYSREAAVSGITSRSLQIVGAVLLPQRYVFFLDPYSLHTIAAQ